MEIWPVRNEADYDAALPEIAGHFEHEPKPGSKATDRFDVLVALIGVYEDKYWPIPTASANLSSQPGQD